MPKKVAAKVKCAYHGEPLTREQFEAEIAARERAPYRNRPLDRATLAALPHPLPSIPGLRLAVLWCPNGGELPADWAISIEADETPITLATLPKPHVGVVSIVARVAELPRPSFDEETVDRIADAIADAFCEEVL